MASSVHLVDVDNETKTWPLPDAKHKFNFRNNYGLIYEADEVKNCIRNGCLYSATMSHDDSVAIARIQDEIRKQIGVVYEADE